MIFYANEIPKLLKYPGGKSRAITQLLCFFPPGTKKVVSPFIGGGSVEMALSLNGVEVCAADAFKPVVSFWHYFLNERKELVKEIKKHHPLTALKFKELEIFLRSSLQEKSLSLKEAATFFVLNRSSFNGKVLSGGMSPGAPRFTERSIRNLAAAEAGSLSIIPYCSDFSETLRQHPDAFLFCDPPYVGRNLRLYGDRGRLQTGFDHVRLSHELKQRKGWLLCYNDCAEVRNLYHGYEFIKLKWSYTMGKKKESNEVLIRG